jgi:hypothetical protein
MTNLATYSVAMSADGSRIAIGAYNNDEYSGHVRVHEVHTQFPVVHTWTHPRTYLWSNG